MPSKKKKYNARFPPARIKKIMQTDEDVGKVAAAVPVIISRSLELFIDSLIEKTASITRGKNAKTLSTSHIKQAIYSEKTFDFLRDLVANVPDHQTEEEADGAVASSSRAQEKKPRVPRPRKPREEGARGPGRPRKVQPEEKKETSTEDSEDDEETESDEEQHLQPREAGPSQPFMPLPPGAPADQTQHIMSPQGASQAGILPHSIPQNAQSNMSQGTGMPQNHQLPQYPPPGQQDGVHPSASYLPPGYPMHSLPFPQFQHYQGGAPPMGIPPYIAGATSVPPGAGVPYMTPGLPQYPPQFVSPPRSMYIMQSPPGGSAQYVSSGNHMQASQPEGLRPSMVQPGNIPDTNMPLDMSVTGNSRSHPVPQGSSATVSSHDSAPLPPLGQHMMPQGYPPRLPFTPHHIPTDFNQDQMVDQNVPPAHTSEAPTHTSENGKHKPNKKSKSDGVRKHDADDNPKDSKSPKLSDNDQKQVSFPGLSNIMKMKTVKTSDDEDYDS